MRDTGKVHRSTVTGLSTILPLLVLNRYSRLRKFLPDLITTAEYIHYICVHGYGVMAVYIYFYTMYVMYKNKRTNLIQ